MKASYVGLALLIFSASPLRGPAADYWRSTQLDSRVRFRSGFGNVVFPGTGTPTQVNPFYMFPTTFAQRLGATVSGYPGYLLGREPYRRGLPAVFPYFIPVFYGGWGYTAGPPQVTVIQTSPPVPSVVIQQYYAVPEAEPTRVRTAEAETPRETVQHYQAPTPKQPVTEPTRRESRSEPESEATLYLIALRDGTIYAAVGYWTEDNQLHWITLQGKRHAVALEALDRPLTQRLNRERGLEIELPNSP